MKLFEINKQIRDFQSACESGEIPEEAIADTLEGLELERDAKIDGICTILKENAIEIDGLKKTVEELSARIKAKQNEGERLKEYLASQCPEKWENEHHKITYRKSEKTVVSEDFSKWALQNRMKNLLDFGEPKPILSAVKLAIGMGLIPEDKAHIETNKNIQVK